MREAQWNRSNVTRSLSFIVCMTFHCTQNRLNTPRYRFDNAYVNERLFCCIIIIYHTTGGRFFEAMLEANILTHTFKASSVELFYKLSIIK